MMRLPESFGGGSAGAPMEVHQLSPLFEIVQRSGMFRDNKTFVDCIPRQPPDAILAAYRQSHDTPGFDLRRFVELHFQLPTERGLALEQERDVVAQITALWQALRREPDAPAPRSSLLPLPHAYIVPGGRFREIYYWDSYFTMLGLRECGDEAMLESMTRNFVHLIERYGYVPNGNRSYYLSRSQPPFLALMVELLAEKRPALLVEFVVPLQAEFDYWMDRTVLTRHAIVLRDGSVLNRYYDQLDTPRPESFAADEALSRLAPGNPATMLRHLRSAAESGWDFSSRWLAEPARLETIQTTDYAPVDLNCFLHQLELTLARAYRASGDTARAHELRAAAARRRRAILKRCWSEPHGFFFDYHLPSERVSAHATLAGVTPLFFRLATEAQARAVAAVLERDFLKPGGLVTTLERSGQQWDAPNGWAPLQWFAIAGLRHYGHHALAAEIARRWISLNCSVYARTGRLMEKYDVIEPEREAGGGEYPNQHGFGWTNGVLLTLLRMYPAAARPTKLCRRTVPR